MKNIRFVTIMLFVIVTMLIGMGATDCENTSEVDVQQAAQTQEMMAEANRQVGMPKIVNFAQRKTLRDIQETVDREDLILYAYVFAENSGQLIFIGKSVGYPIPAAAQFTNPEYIAYTGTNVGVITLPQPDPNGLYMPSSADATWIMLIDPTDNVPKAVYIEPKVICSPFLLEK